MSAARFELLALWREIKFGFESDLTIPALQSVQTAWREADGFEDKTLAAMLAANAQGDGVWESVCRVGLEEVVRTDEADKQEFEAVMARVHKSKTVLATRAEDMARLQYIKRSGNATFRAWGIDEE